MEEKIRNIAGQILYQKLLIFVATAIIMTIL